MTKKSRKIVQCPFCDSNRLYFRRGLVADVLISLLIPVRSYTCGSCSRSFRKYGNYFTSRQALIHVFALLAFFAFINPRMLLPQSWFLQEQQVVTPESIKEQSDKTLPEIKSDTELPLLSMTIANATNSSLVVENGTFSVVKNYAGNKTDSAANSTISAVGTSETILSFNATQVANSTKQPVANQSIKSGTNAAEKTQGLQEGKLKSIYFKAIDGKTRINLDLGGSPLSYTSFFLRAPDRLVVDIHGNWEYYGPTTLRPENPIFSRFRIGIYDDKIRMVMDLKGQTPAPVITKTGTGLNIDVK